MRRLSDPRELTRDYEEWLGRRIPLETRDLALKHQKMAADEYRFLRGTYYLWLDRVAVLVPEMLRYPRVPLVGDLHVENYGSWCDADGVRRWGVNDYDELARGPWALDLLRLATSAVLAPHMGLGKKRICAAVLEGWADARPRPAVDLSDKHARHLRDLVPAPKETDRFYDRLAAGAVVDDVPADVVAAAVRIAPPGWRPTWRRHEAGTGSLGHVRRVGVGPADDQHRHAREAKQFGPGAALWATARHTGMPVADHGLFASVGRAVHGPAAATRVEDWHIRDLAPAVVRITPTGLGEKKTARLLRAMAAAAADVHGADPAAFAPAQAASIDEKEFHDAVKLMAKATTADHERFAGR